MRNLETLSHLETVSRQLGLCVDHHCLGLALTVLVLCLETKTVHDKNLTTFPGKYVEIKFHFCEQNLWPNFVLLSHMTITSKREVLKTVA